jgi:hypothetical protein
MQGLDAQDEGEFGTIRFLRASPSEIEFATDSPLEGNVIRTFGSAMRSHRRQRGRGLTPPNPGGEWRLLGQSPDNSIGMPRPATAQMTGAPVDRPQLGRTHETVAYLARN